MSADPVKYDVVVAGAGPAGSVAARALAGRDRRVLLVDRARFPRWKVCGACLGPRAIAILESEGLGALPARAGAVPLRCLTVVSGTRRAVLPLGGSVVLSRTVLDTALLDEARAAGAAVREGVRAALASRRREGIAVELAGPAGVETVWARTVVDATGLAGGLAVGARDGDATGAAGRPVVAKRSRFGLGATFGSAPRELVAGQLVMVVGREGYVGLVRDEAGRLVVGAAVDGSLLAERGPRGAVAHILLALQGRVTFGLPLFGPEAFDLSDPEQGWRGTPALTRHAPGVEGRVFRIGDAAAYVEPFTGEGMGWALEQAVRVAPFIEATLGGGREAGAAWAREQAHETRRSRRLCRTLSWGLRRPRLVDSVIAVLSRFPSVGRPLVAATAP